MLPDDLLDRINALAARLDHDTRMAAITVLISAWVWEENHLPDDVRRFREAALSILSHPRPAPARARRARSSA